ncbi:unnamed protein product [marine sediment metagenome]|uniref:Uncharacterized protein n=1 Tax=marine sediment metagenome TaxID=412755 RepID=X1D416_9ZZZZ
MGSTKIESEDVEMKKIIRNFVNSQISLQDEINIIKECEKTIYDKIRQYLIKHQIKPTGAFRQGIDVGRNALHQKRKQLEKKLKSDSRIFIKRS